MLALDCILHFRKILDEYFLKSTLEQLTWYHFGMTTVSWFLSKLLVSLMRNYMYFTKCTSGAPLHALSKLYDVPVGFVSSPSFEAVYCYICGRQRVAVARYRMICFGFFYKAEISLIVTYQPTLLLCKAWRYICQSKITLKCRYHFIYRKSGTQTIINT